jgi:hypothetical protein
VVTVEGPSSKDSIARNAIFRRFSPREITGLEWNRVELARQTAWLNRTKNGTPRGVPLNGDAVAVLEGERGRHPQYCFTYRGEPIRWDVTNTAWETALRKAGIDDFRFHDLRHTWASWHRQAGTSCDELKDLAAGRAGRWCIPTPSSRRKIRGSRRGGSTQCVLTKLARFCQSGAEDRTSEAC